MKLNVNIDSIPDTMPVIEPGDYTFEVLDVVFKEAEPSKTGDGEGRKDRFEFKLQITTEGPMKGRTIFDSFNVEHLSDPNHFAAVRFKRFCKSIGVSGNNIDTDDLKGKGGRFTINHRTYVDKSTQEQKTAANIKDYVFAAA